MFPVDAAALRRREGCDCCVMDDRLGTVLGLALCVRFSEKPPRFSPVKGRVHRERVFLIL